MYIFKNAITSIRRSKGRNILIGIIIIVIAVSCTITLAITESANQIVSAYEEKNAIESTIEMNRNTLMKYLRDNNKSQEEMVEAFNNIENITEEEINNYGNSKYVKDYYYTYELNVDAKNLTEATDSLVKETTTTKTETTTSTKTKRFGGTTPPSGVPNRNGKGSNNSSSGSSTTTTTKRKTTTKQVEKIFNEKAGSGAFKLIGYNSYEDMKDFINGNYIITDGEVSSNFESDSCVISEELSTLNKLSVGDTITIIDPKTTSKTYKLTITGIYKENSEKSNNMTDMFTSSANNIITNTSFIKKMLKSDSKLSATISPTFIIKDKESVELFRSEVNEKGLSEYYQVTDNLEEIESATEVVNNVKIFATTFLIITLAIGGVVLIVINMINIRERKYEIGVLRTIGMKKSKVSLQFISELLIVCVISLTLGAIIGSYASVPVSNMLLQNEIENANEKYNNISNNFGFRNRKENDKEKVEMEETNKENKELDSKEEIKDNPNDIKYNFGLVNINEVDNFEAVVNLSVLLKLYGLGLALTLISSLATMISISRFSPLTILKERS